MQAYSVVQKTNTYSASSVNLKASRILAGNKNVVPAGISSKSSICGGHVNLSSALKKSFAEKAYV